jgi:sugar phosphate isomerase/epimerase
MPAITRRAFFGNASGAAAILAAAGPGRANPLGLPIGSQTYPHRQRIKDGDFAGLCKEMVTLGVTNLELCSPGYGEFASLADAKQTARVMNDYGIKCPSAHFTLNELRNKQQESIAWAHEIGMTQMGTASLNGRVQDGTTTMDIVKRLADEYNKIGEAAAKAGIQQFLHDERFEMAKVDGRVTYEVLLELLDPKLVKMQFQMSAMPAVGDVVGYFTKYPGRFISMHLQGVPAEQPSPGPGRTPGVAVGKDSLDWAKIFGAANTGGVKNYFVEQTWELTVQSVEFLKGLKA